ncbi:hypothetical protein AB1L30_21375 [Bremerella sp. JC817]|uniref:hypothetical protein n=1 Tax=Bremerella sp. JC817 TaxID=3231756 RepID=UPI003458C3E7
MSPPSNRPLARQWRRIVMGLTVGVCLAVATDRAYADRLILRDLRLISNVTVVGFDEEGVKVTDNNLIPWHEIELGTVAPDKQADFDRLRNDLGLPLYRIHQRLTVGDYGGLQEPAEAVFERYKDRDSKTAYMVCQATMWGRLANGQREAALEAYFCCIRCLKANRSEPPSLPGPRRLEYDKQTGLSTDLLPLFFDQAAAAEALPKAASVANSLGQKAPEAVNIYMAALAIAAHDFAEAEKWERKLKTGNPTLKQWNDLLAAQTQVQTGNLIVARSELVPVIHTMDSCNLPVAWYLQGVAGARSSEFLMIEHGVLDLLHVPALYGNDQPELAAAALLEAHNALLRIKQPDQAADVRRQLLLFYGGTSHAKQIRSSRQLPSNP